MHLFNLKYILTLKSVRLTPVLAVVSNTNSIIQREKDANKDDC